MTDLADFTSRLRTLLGDSAGTRYPAGMTDEAFRQSLAELNSVLPLTAEQLHIVSAAGVEQAIAGVSEFQQVLRVWFPYDPGAPDAPPLADFNAWHDGAALRLRVGGGRVPAVGERLRVLYTRAHTIAGLDGATVSTINPARHSLLVLGAAGFAAALRAATVLENYGKRAQDHEQLTAWSNRLLLRFRFQLELLARTSGALHPLPAAGWTREGRMTFTG